MMATRQWWERPRLWGSAAADAHAERRVSWLELFSDLIFVVVIADLAHYLAEHTTWSGLLGYGLLFVAGWWAWIGGTFYNERFETQDVSHRLFTFLQIITVAGLAIFAHDGLGTNSAGFALAYAANRVLIIVLWLRGGWHAPLFRPVSNRYAIGFSLSVALFVGSIFVPSPWRFVLWGLGLACDLLAPVTTLHLQARLPRTRTSKLPERFGLFVIIVLGETIVGVIGGLAEIAPFSPRAVVAGTLGLTLAFGFWWIYFDFIARRLPRPGVWSLLGWGYLHMPLLMAVTASSAGVLNLLAHDATAGAGVRWLLAGSVALALLVIGLIEMLLRRESDEPTTPPASVGIKWGAAAGALAVGLAGRELAPPLFLGTLVALLLPPMIYGAWVWYHQAAADALMPEAAD
jgi:low temperature requirement protein LtrA